MELSDGRGESFYGKVIPSHRKDIIKVGIRERIDDSAESPLSITLWQGLLKGEKMDLVIRQAIELGVSRVVPLSSARSVPELTSERARKKLERWSKIARTAAAQSRRSLIPVVSSPVNWHYIPALLDPGEFSVFFWEKEKEQGLPVFPGATVSMINVIVGPEGGFNREEAQQLKELNVQPAGLGKRILRAETAAIAAITLAQVNYGDLGEANV